MLSCFFIRSHTLALLPLNHSPGYCHPTSNCYPIQELSSSFKLSSHPGIVILNEVKDLVRSPWLPSLCCLIRPQIVFLSDSEGSRPLARASLTQELSS